MIRQQQKNSNNDAYVHGKEVEPHQCDRISYLQCVRCYQRPKIIYLIWANSIESNKSFYAVKFFSPFLIKLGTELTAPQQYKLYVQQMCILYIDACTHIHSIWMCRIVTCVLIFMYVYYFCVCVCVCRNIYHSVNLYHSFHRFMHGFCGFVEWSNQKSLVNWFVPPLVVQ